MNDKNYEVLTNIIGAVESGGQVYGKRRYEAYADPYTNSPKEHTITLGAFQSYGYEANELMNMIFNSDPDAFRAIDKDHSIEAMLPKDWVALKWKPTETQKQRIIKIITTETGKAMQDKQFKENRLKKYIARAENFGIKDIPTQMMWAEVQHLGGVNPTERVFKRCNGSYGVDSVMTALKKDQAETGSNSVSSKKYWSRHEKCAEFVKKYAEDENMGYDVNKLLMVAEEEIGYLEKASNSQLDDKTANAGYNNYTKYWRDMAPSYQGQAWCDCFVDWCFTRAFGSSAAQELECGGCGAFYTPTSAQCYKNKSRWFTTPQVGDQIFFKNSVRIHHTGLVVAVNGSVVTTIEGNTSNGSSVVANGGAVCKKQYQISNGNIAGYGRPNYGSAPSGGKIMLGVKTVSSGSSGQDVRLLQILLRDRGFKGADGKKLDSDGECGANTVHAINGYEEARRKQGVELGTNGSNDGTAGKKFWNDITGGLVIN